MNTPDHVVSLRIGKTLFLEQYLIGQIKMDPGLHACSFKHKVLVHLEAALKLTITNAES
jgi:hypothetical protein